MLSSNYFFNLRNAVMNLYSVNCVKNVHFILLRCIQCGQNYIVKCIKYILNNEFVNVATHCIYIHTKLMSYNTIHGNKLGKLGNWEILYYYGFIQLINTVQKVLLFYFSGMTIQDGP